MKKIVRILLLFGIFFFIFNQIILATDTTEAAGMEEILNEQEKELGISDFIDLSEKYTEENLEGINIKEFFNSAITGKIGNTNLFNNVLNIFGKELKSAITNIRYYSYHHYYT